MRGTVFSHKHFSTGLPCKCTWTKHLGPRSPNGTTAAKGDPPDDQAPVKNTQTPFNPDKFFTSETQHERRKKNWIEWIWKRSVADPDWVKDWIEKQGPYMYHATTQEAIPKIKSEGLFPHDHLGTGEEVWKCPSCSHTQMTEPDKDPQGYAQCPRCHDDYLKEIPGNSNSEYADGYWEPRAGHVYLGTSHYASNYTNKGNSALVRVDLRKLDPVNFSADEDHWHPNNPNINMNHPAVQQVHEYDPPPSIYDFDEGGETLGHWADGLNLGSEPEETHYSMGMGSMAYHGHIPAHAIEHVSPYNHEPYSYDEEGKPYVALSKWGNWKVAGDMWHLAPTSERERIRQHGLIPARPKLNPMWEDANPNWLEKQPEGVYVMNRPAPHEDVSARMEGYDRWRVPAEQIKQLIPDGPFGESFIIPHRVDPILEEGPEHRWNWPKRLN